MGFFNGGFGGGRPQGFGRAMQMGMPQGGFGQNLQAGGGMRPGMPMVGRPGSPMGMGGRGQPMIGSPMGMGGRGMGSPMGFGGIPMAFGQRMGGGQPQGYARPNQQGPGGAESYLNANAGNQGQGQPYGQPQGGISPQMMAQMMGGMMGGR